MNRRDIAGRAGSGWIKRILVAADGSPASAAGIQQAANMASQLGAELTVVFVRHVPAAAPLADGLVEASIEQTQNELELEVMHDALDMLDGTGAEWEFVVRSGSPGHEIAAVADEVSADIVVVGSNRHSSLHNLVIGSTAAYLATHSRVPVLVMRPRTSGSVGDPDASMALVPPGHGAFHRWEMTESSPQGGARRRPEVLRVLPNGGEQR
jgi:nucleotide-binding universal stress UspA family protein